MRIHTVPLLVHTSPACSPGRAEFAVVIYIVISKIEILQSLANLCEILRFGHPVSDHAGLTGMPIRPMFIVLWLCGVGNAILTLGAA